MRPAFALAAASLLALAASCTTLAGLDDFEIVGSGGAGGHGASAGGAQCSSPADCPGADTTCRSRSCDDGTCGMDDAPRGTSCTEGLGEVCNGEGTCVFDLGHPCGASAECVNGFCADDVCCDTACDATCQACVSAETGGADGTCGPIATFADPDGECTAPPALGCGISGCATCGATATPPGGSCPAAPTCDYCENGNTCVVDCDLDTECDLRTIDCPAGWHCKVLCREHNACRDVILNCPTDYRCSLICAAGGHSCQRLTQNCSTNGPCTIECTGGADNCVDAVVNCQSNDCTAHCFGVGDEPSLQSCTGPCDCTGC